MNKIFITGGSGFIGSHLCEALADKHKIVVFDSLKRDSLKDSKTRHHPNLTLVQGDVRKPEDLSRALGDCDTVIHCAAIAGIDSVGLSPMDTMDVNLLGSHHLLEAVKDKKIQRYIQFSTSEVYGPYIYLGTENDLTSQGPIGQIRWAYAVSKLAAEHYAYSYWHKYKLPVVSVRPFNIYGPGQVGEGAIQKFIKKAVNGENLEIYGDGSQIRSWCYISDFVDGILRCLREEKAVGQVFNLGNPQTGITTAELAQLVITLSDSKSKIIYKDALPADVKVRVPSVQKAKDLLGFIPKIDLTTGIRNTIAWYRTQQR